MRTGPIIVSFSVFGIFKKWQILTFLKWPCCWPLKLCKPHRLKKKWTLWVYMRSLENYKTIQVSITRHFVSSVWYKCICNNYRWPTLTVSSVLTKLSWRLSVSIWMKQFRRGFWFSFRGECLGGALHHPLQPLSQVNESRKYTQDFLT